MSIKTYSIGLEGGITSGPEPLSPIMDAMKFSGADGAVEWVKRSNKVYSIQLAAGSNIKATAKETAAAIQLTSAKFSDESISFVNSDFYPAAHKIGLYYEDFALDFPEDIRSKRITLYLENVTLADFLDKLADLTGTTLEWNDKGVSFISKGKK